MPATWPSQLQDLVNEDNFSTEIGETAIRSNNDIGPDKVRRRFTKSVDPITCSIDLTTSQYSVLYYFYDTTLNGGVNTFNFNHPITGAVGEYRFRRAPVYKSLGGGMFRASMEWEILP